jgi:hypothetical protein
MEKVDGHTVAKMRTIRAITIYRFVIARVFSLGNAMLQNLNRCVCTSGRVVYSCLAHGSRRSRFGF